MEKFRINWQTGEILINQGGYYASFRKFNEEDFESESEVIAWAEFEWNSVNGVSLSEED